MGVSEKDALQALVVENDLTSRELLARVLRRRGFDTRTAVGVGQAAEVLQSSDRRFDLLIVDLNLEPVDGVELLRQVAVMPGARRPRTIIVIADALAAFYPRLGELQLELDLFQKPVHLASLMKVSDALKH
jgi:CheY-like chemotaxis protein